MHGKRIAQGTAYDHHMKKLNYLIGDRVVLHMPYEESCKTGLGPFQIPSITLMLMLDLSTGPMNLQFSYLSAESGLVLNPGSFVGGELGTLNCTNVAKF